MLLPAAISQPLSQAGPSRFVAAYPWGMTHNYNPQFAIGNLFMLYQSFTDAPANVNSAAFLWGMPNPYSSQGFEVEETPTINDDNVEGQEPECKGPHLNFHISTPPVHPNPYASAALVPQFPNNIGL